MPVDKRTLIACKKGKRKAIKSLYEACAGWMLGVARRYIKDRNEAMSVVNLSILTALENLEKFNLDRDEKFEAWLKTILIRKLIDYQRKAVKDTKVIELSEVSNPPISNDSGDALTNAESLKRLIGSLPTQTRTVFNLYAVEGYKHKEIAEMLEISEGTSKWHLSEARKKLQAQLNAIDKRFKNISV